LHSTTFDGFLEARDEFGQTPLLLAVSRSDVACVTLLLDHGANPCVADLHGTPVLSLASDSVVVMKLLQAGANPKATDSTGETAVHRFVRQSLREPLEALLRHDAELVHLECRWYGSGVTPLSLAMQCGHLSLAKRCIAMGADANARAESREFLLHKFVKDRDLSLVQMLLQARADPNRLSPITGSHVLCYEMCASMATLLLNNGADPNVWSRAGPSPLVLALQRGHLDVACLLLRHGAEVDVIGDDGQSALQICAGLATASLAPTAACSIIAKSHNLDHRDAKGLTALHRWVEKYSSFPSSELLSVI